MLSRFSIIVGSGISSLTSVGDVRDVLMFTGLPGHWIIGSVVSLGVMGATLTGAGAGLGKGLTMIG